MTWRASCTWPWIEVCTTVVDASKMARAYELCKIGNLAQKINGRGAVDILGVVTAVGELGTIRKKSDNSELQKREITLLDETKRTVGPFLSSVPSHPMIWRRGERFLMWHNIL